MATKPMSVSDDMRSTLQSDVTEWEKANEALTRLADIEKTMRIALFDKYFALNPKLKEGTNHIELGGGRQLTADYRINRRVDEAQLDAAMAMGLDRALVDELIAFKPSLKIGDWKSTSPEVRRIFADIVTEAPGTPGLKISTPKR